MNLAEFHFIRPYWLLAFIPAIFFFIRLLDNKLKQGNWSSICDQELLPFVIQDRDINHSHWALSLGFVSSLLIIIALAGPRWERLPSPVFRNDAGLVIALDLSLSMDATDISPSRLTKARYKVADILTQRKDGQTALIVYAGDVFTVTPLTDDNATIISQLSALTTDIMPSQGSNAPAAINKAVSLLKQAGLHQGDILVVTDGIVVEHTLKTVQSLKPYRLSILGVGTADGAPIKDSQGGFVKDAEGNIVVPKLNNQALSQLAQAGRGRYTSIKNDDSDIEILLEQFDHAVETKAREGHKNNNLLTNQWSEKGPWLLLLVLPLAAFSFRKGLLSITLMILLPIAESSHALEWKDLWLTQDQQAQQAFAQGNFQQAAKQYTHSQWKAAAQYKAQQFNQAATTLKDDQSAVSLYNKGNALAQTGQFQEAIAAYQQSLQLEPDNEDAKYNKKTSEKALKQQQQQLSDKKQARDKNSTQKDKNESAEGEKTEQSEGQRQQHGESETEPTQTNQSSTGQQFTKNKNEAMQVTENSKDKDNNAPEAEKMHVESFTYDESKQANEQWLKRIKDDPAELLKRKFKYQYERRKQKNTHSKNGLLRL